MAHASRLGQFLSVANRLKIKGLSQALDTTANKEESFYQGHKVENAEEEHLFVAENRKDKAIEQDIDTIESVPNEEAPNGCYLNEESSDFLSESNIGYISEKLECQVCGRSFPSNSQLNNHMDNKHEQEGVFHPCHICDKTFKTKNARYVHKFRNHKNKLG